MITHQSIKQTIERIHENFNFRDIIGFSSLIFGLVLSNASISSSGNTHRISEPQVTQTEQKQPTQVSKKKSRSKQIVKKKKKRTIKNLNKQTRTASRNKGSNHKKNAEQ